MMEELSGVDRPRIGVVSGVKEDRGDRVHGKGLFRENLPGPGPGPGPSSEEETTDLKLGIEGDMSNSRTGGIPGVKTGKSPTFSISLSRARFEPRAPVMGADDLSSLPLPEPNSEPWPRRDLLVVLGGALGAV